MPFRFNRCTGRLLPLILLLALPLPVESRGQADQEKKLTKRVDQIYQLFVSGDWEKVQTFLTEDTRHIWLAAAKSKIASYHIESVNVAPDGKQANVTVMATLTIPQAYNTPFSQPQKSEWVYQKGNWFMKMRARPSMIELFKSLAPPPNPLGSVPPVVFDQNPIKLPSPKSGAESMVSVSVQNVSPLTVSIQNLVTNCPCLTAELDTTELRTGEKAVLTITYRRSPYDLSEPPLSIHANIWPDMYLLNLPVVFSDDK